MHSIHTTMIERTNIRTYIYIHLEISLRQVHYVCVLMDANSSTYTLINELEWYHSQVYLQNVWTLAIDIHDSPGCRESFSPLSGCLVALDRPSCSRPLRSILCRLTCLGLCDFSCRKDDGYQSDIADITLHFIT